MAKPLKVTRTAASKTKATCAEKAGLSKVGQGALGHCFHPMHLEAAGSYRLTKGHFSWVMGFCYLVLLHAECRSRFR